MDSISTENYQLELPYKPSSVSVYWKKITIPKGLPALLETFVREIIRDNPDDIHNFLTDLTETLLAKRSEEEKAESTSATVESNTVSPTKIKQVDEESPLLASQAPSPTSQKGEPEAEQEVPEEVIVIPSSPSSPQQKDPPQAASLPESEESSNANEFQPLEVEAVTKLQAGYRGYKTRKTLKEQRQQGEELGDGVEESSKNENDDKEPSLEIGTSPEEIAAATKLQAGFRGFQTRKSLKQQHELGKQESDEAKLPPNTDDENLASEPTVEQPSAEEVTAATKLQAGFRGFQTRRALKGEKEQETQPSSRPAPSPQLEGQDAEAEPQNSISSSVIPENEEVVGDTIISIDTDPVSQSPFPASTSSEEANDEEIAAEIKTPLETIREESFDHSISSCHAVPPSTGVVDKGGSETPPTPSATELENNVEDIPPVTSKAPSASRDENNFNVHVVSNDDIHAALGDLLDTESEKEESSSDGSDPSLQENGVTKETSNVDIVDDGKNNNDTDNKNDELESSSAADPKDENDLAPIQDCDHQLDPTEDGLEKSNNNVSIINDSAVDTPQSQECEESISVADHNEGDRVEVIDENTQNNPQINGEGVEAKEEEEITEQPQEAINLSSLENAGISDQPDFDGKEQEETGGDDDEDDKNKQSESPRPVDDVDGDGGEEKDEIEQEISAEKNTPNIVDVAMSPVPQEVGQQAHNDDEGLDDDDQIRGGEADAEKSDSIQLQHSNASPLTDSSVDREDTDIATPTDFSNHEEKESLNLEELKKFASNFETEMEPEGSVASAADTTSPVPAEPTTDVSSSSPEGTSSSPAGEVMQVEVKASESTTPAALNEAEGVEPAAVQSPEPVTESAQPLLSPEVSAQPQPADESQPDASPEISQLPSESKEEIVEEKVQATDIPQQSQKSPEVSSPEPAGETNTTEQPLETCEDNSAEPEAKSNPDSAASEPLKEEPAIADKSPETPQQSSESEAKTPEQEVSPKSPEPQEQKVVEQVESLLETETVPETPMLPESSQTNETEQPQPSGEVQHNSETPQSLPECEEVKVSEEPKSPEPTQEVPEVAEAKAAEETEQNATPSPTQDEQKAPEAVPTTQDPEATPSSPPTEEPSSPSVATAQEEAKPENSPPTEEIANPTTQEEREIPRIPQKPTVKPRLSSSKQSKSVAIEDPPTAIEIASPVLRRPKSGPGRSRAATSKYRSGRVIDNQLSMDEMEKEIEDEMMNNAAVKIQAGFRGFKTRKRMSSQFGVSKKRGESTDESNPTAAKVIASDDASASSEPSASSVDNASAERLLSPEQVSAKGDDVLGERIASRGASAKPPLSTLRSHSFPGSHDPEDIQHILEFDEDDEDRLINPEQEIDLDLDPDYINNAAVRIQKSFRGYQVRKSLKRCPSGKENNGNKGSVKSLKLAGSEENEEMRESQNIMDRLQEHNKESSEEPDQPEKAAAKIQASFRSYKERTKYQKKKKAAITLQANIRGFLTRKRLANLRRRSFQRRRSSAKAFQKELEDIRKVNDAATKIQAVFRGYQVRSKILPRSSSMIEHEQMVDE